MFCCCCCFIFFIVFLVSFGCNCCCSFCCISFSATTIKAEWAAINISALVVAYSNIFELIWALFELFSTPPLYTTPHYTTPQHTTPHHTTPHHTTPHHTTPHHTTPHHTTPHHTTPHHTKPHHTTPHHTTPHHVTPQPCVKSVYISMKSYSTPIIAVAASVSIVMVTSMVHLISFNLIISFQFDLIKFI